MSAFREAFAARDSGKRIVHTLGGERVVPGRHSSQRRGDEAALRRDLATDLAALLNTVELDATVNLDRFEYVRRSILNYGLRDISRLNGEKEQADKIQDDLRTALVRFEPRLNPDTIHIERDEEAEESDQRVRFRVAVEMFCNPIDVSIDFIAEVDTGSGKLSLSRLPVAT